MSRDSKSKRRRKRARREKNRRDREELLSTTPTEPRVRNPFRAKARRGDEAEIAVQFGDRAVPFDAEADDPAGGVERRHRAAESWDAAGNPTAGDA